MPHELRPDAPEAARTLADAVDAVLPQTQCQRCGFDGCRPYAQALAAGTAQINRCPPGGVQGMAQLAELLGRPRLALDPACGAEGPLRLARIDEERCIGCALCLAACPVDAILGAFKQMHTVLAEDCTGCELCLAPCPVDCIEMVAPQPVRDWTPADAERSRTRHERHLARGRESAQALETDQRSRLIEAARQRAAARRPAGSAQG